jgi:hypothetical protein
MNMTHGGGWNIAEPMTLLEDLSREVTCSKKMILSHASSTAEDQLKKPDVPVHCNFEIVHKEKSGQTTASCWIPSAASSHGQFQTTGKTQHINMRSNSALVRRGVSIVSQWSKA